jgi:hypothetical protein
MIASTVYEKEQRRAFVSPVEIMELQSLRDVSSRDWLGVGRGENFHAAALSAPGAEPA